ncbi:MAG: S-layer homology domain-containing protein [Oscillospiraceae bacterium]|nr:S-layer homology domain-containing protein [Oscillospiraceae bacterium]
MKLNLKKTLSILLVALLIIGLLPMGAMAATSAVELEVHVPNGYQGDIVDLEIRLAGNTGVTQLVLDVSFDPTVMRPVQATGATTLSPVLGPLEAMGTVPFPNMGIFPAGNGFRSTIAAGGLMGSGAGQIFSGENVTLLTMPFEIIGSSGDASAVNLDVSMMRIGTTNHNNPGTALLSIEQAPPLQVQTPPAGIELEVIVPNGSPGDIVDLEIRLNRNTGITQLVLDVSFDPAVMRPVQATGATILSPVLGPLEAMGTVPFPNMGIFPAGNGFRSTIAAGGLMGSGAGQIFSGENVVLLTMPFEIIGNIGDTSAVNLDVSMMRIGTTNHNNPSAALLSIVQADDLDVVDIPADFTALQTAQTAALARVEANYTPDSWTPFVTARNAAADVLATQGTATEATQAQVDTALGVLNTTMGNLSARANFAALTAAITAAEARVEARYTTASWTAANLASAIPAAITVRDNLNATQQQVDTALSALNTATGQLMALVDTLPPGINVPDDWNIEEDGNGNLILTPPGGAPPSITIPSDPEDDIIIETPGGGTVLVPPDSDITVTEPDGDIVIDLPDDGGTITIPNDPDGDIVIDTPGGGTVVVPPDSDITVTEPDGDIVIELPDDGGTITIPNDPDGDITIEIPGDDGDTVITLPPGSDVEVGDNGDITVSVPPGGPGGTITNPDGTPGGTIPPGGGAVIDPDNPGDIEIIQPPVVTPPGGGGGGGGGAPTPSPTPTPTPPAPDFPFTDVPENAWYRPYVEQVWEMELMNGVSDTEFAPHANLSRAMTATILYRLAGEPAVSFSPIFSDVPAGRWYSNAIVWAAQNDIVQGVGDGRFAPHANVTREQIATMLFRYADTMELSTASDGFVQTFLDADEISVWAREAMEWANYNGLINGLPNGTLNPGGTATRAERAAIIVRFVDSLK